MRKYKILLPLFMSMFSQQLMGAESFTQRLGFDWIRYDDGRSIEQLTYNEQVLSQALTDLVGDRFQVTIEYGEQSIGARYLMIYLPDDVTIHFKTNRNQDVNAAEPIHYDSIEACQANAAQQISDYAANHASLQRVAGGCFHFGGGRNAAKSDLVLFGLE